MIDDKLTHNMQEWLDSESHDRESILRGAEMLLKLNRNMALYQTIIRRPERYESKVRYELKKFLPMRLAKMTLQNVKALDAELVPQVKAAVDEQEAHDQEGEADDDASFLPAASGIRADHDSLPDSVRCVWSDNRERWHKIKQLYNTLLGIEQPCDRYEYLCQLKELWYTYKSELQRYDDYQPAADNVDEQLSPADIAKEIANARSYITKYADKLLSLREATLKTDDAKAFEEYSALQKKVQKRVAVLADNKAPIGDDLKTKLDEAGVFVPSAE